MGDVCSKSGTGPPALAVNQSSAQAVLSLQDYKDNSAASIELRCKVIADIVKDITEGMLARAEQSAAAMMPRAPSGRRRRRAGNPKYTDMTGLARSARRVSADMRSGCAADPRQVPEGNPLFLDSRKINGLRKARSLFLEWGRGSPGTIIQNRVPGRSGALWYFIFEDTVRS